MHCSTLIQATGDPCPDIGVKISATKFTAPGKTLRVQVIVYDDARMGAVSKPQDTVMGDQLLVSLTLPNGVIVDDSASSSKSAAYNATVTNGVLTWRGANLARSKQAKFSATFTVASLDVLGPLFFVASAQRITGFGALLCATPTTTAKVKVKTNK